MEPRGPPRAAPVRWTMPTPTPAASLIDRLDAELARHPPFAQMAAEPRRRFVEATEQLYYAPGETVLEPGGGPVQHLQVLRSGRIEGTPGGGAPEPFTIEPGELFPVGAALGERAVTSTCRAVEDSFCGRVPVRPR
jgi:CBS domain-containing protein